MFSVLLQYVEIRRRITSFITDFTEEFLLGHCFPYTNNNNNNNIKIIEKTVELQKIRCWIETTSILGDWLTEPNRLNTFADIITPFLYGLFYVSKITFIILHHCHHDCFVHIVFFSYYHTLACL